jgi:flagellar assembly factor FliW
VTAVLPEIPVTSADLPELSFRGGLAGFPDAERFALVEVPEVAPLFLLRSLDQPGLEFVVAPPAALFPDYAPVVDDLTATRLDLTDERDALLLVVLTVSASGATANLLAPVIVNQRTRAAAQVVLHGDWPLRAPLRSA